MSIMPFENTAGSNRGFAFGTGNGEWEPRGETFSFFLYFLFPKSNPRLPPSFCASATQRDQERLGDEQTCALRA